MYVHNFRVGYMFFFLMLCFGKKNLCFLFFHQVHLYACLRDELIYLKLQLFHCNYCIYIALWQEQSNKDIQMKVVKQTTQAVIVYKRLNILSKPNQRYSFGCGATSLYKYQQFAQIVIRKVEKRMYAICIFAMVRYSREEFKKRWGTVYSLKLLLQRERLTSIST